MPLMSDFASKQGIIFAEHNPKNSFMKKTPLIVTATIAAMTLALAGCEKEKEEEPTPAMLAYNNPLVGTKWVYHNDTNIMGIRVVQELRLTFHTDSTGESYIGSEDSYSPWWDTTYSFRYIFHPELNGLELYEDEAPYPSYFRYNPENSTLTQGSIVFHPQE